MEPVLPSYSAFTVSAHSEMTWRTLALEELSSKRETSLVNPNCSLLRLSQHGPGNLTGVVRE